jgi:hypothetical protein
LELKTKQAERGHRHRAKTTVHNGRQAETTVTNGRPAKKAASACDIDWENHRESPTETGAHIRKRAVDWQLHEAVRLAEEFALCRPDTERREITLTIVRKINGVIKAWKKLHKDMLAKAGGGKG